MRRGPFHEFPVFHVLGLIVLVVEQVQEASPGSSARDFEGMVCAFVGLSFHRTSREYAVGVFCSEILNRAKVAQLGGQESVLEVPRGAVVKMVFPSGPSWSVVEAGEGR